MINPMLIRLGIAVGMVALGIYFGITGKKRKADVPDSARNRAGDTHIHHYASGQEPDKADADAKEKADADAKKKADDEAAQKKADEEAAQKKADDEAAQKKADKNK